MEALGFVYIAFVVLGILIAILWILLPFAVFGSKDLLRELIREQKRNNELLQKMVPRPSEPPL
ncbi:MAG: hypothetical protein EOO23_04740 [Comamonadaceae bacterium]|nr:MAG: hypothetical protein EOO23_04740 [Comamonadaceae bacterium]